jgi:hypothetical protein
MRFNHLSNKQTQHKIIMKTTYIIIAFFLSLCLQHSLAQTQFLAQEAYQNKISFSTGLEPALIYNLRYDRKSTLPFSSISNSYFFKVEATPSRGLSENSEWSIGTLLLLWEKNKFQVLYEMALANGQLETRLYAAKKWEWANTLEAGLFGKKTGISLFTSYTQNLGLKMVYSDFYKETIYDEGKEGWFNGVGAYFDLGLKGQILVKERLNIQLLLKTAITSGGYPLNILPTQASIGLGWRL